MPCCDWGRYGELASLPVCFTSAAKSERSTEIVVITVMMCLASGLGTGDGKCHEVEVASMVRAGRGSCAAV